MNGAQRGASLTRDVTDKKVIPLSYVKALPRFNVQSLTQVSPIIYVWQYVIGGVLLFVDEICVHYAPNLHDAEQPSINMLP